MVSGIITKVAGPLVIAEGMRNANMFDVVRVSSQRLIGEIIEMHGDRASIQVYEETAGLSPDDIDYVNAHGTSTHMNDLGETEACKTVFGARAKDVPISSVKSMTGHMLGAAGGVECIATALTVENDMLPPTINYETIDVEEGLDLDYVPNVSRKHTVRAAISNNFGFGGHNACVVLKKFAE